MALFVSGACLLVTLSASLLSAQVAENQASEQAKSELSSAAADMAGRLDLMMFERFREVRNVAELQPLKQIWEGPPDAIRAVLNQLQSTLPVYSWIGFATLDGTVRAATKGTLEGVSVAQRPWFIEGLYGPTVQDVHDAKLLARELAPSSSGEPFRFVDVAIPVRNGNGRPLGVLGAHMSWSWAAEARQAVLSSMQPEQGTQIWILNKAGEILLGAGLGSVPFSGETLSDMKRLGRTAFVQTGKDAALTAAAMTSGYRDYPGLGWIVIARRPIHVALAPARKLALTIVAAGSTLALLSAAFAVALAFRLTNPLRQLAKTLDLIGRDERVTMVGRGHGSSDVVRLSSSVRSLLRRIGSAQTEGDQAKREAEAVAQRLDEKTRRFGEDLNALRILADTDPLTGMLNRRAFHVFASDAMSYFRRYQRHIAVLVIDIDFFKRVNDMLGHASGDDVIKSVGAAIASTVRGTDKVARFGGEEFVVLLRETDTEGSLIFAERLRQLISKSAIETQHSGPVHVTVSVGLATAQDSDRDIDDVIQRADRALYVAKASGRDRVSADDSDPVRKAA